MPQPMLFVAVPLVSLLLGLIGYQWMSPPPPAAVPTPYSPAGPEIVLSPDQQPRWFRKLEANAPWQYGVIPSITEKDNPTIYEVSSIRPDTELSEKQKYTANAFKLSVMEAAYNNGWDTIEKARSDGFSNAPPLDFLHYVNPRYTEDNEILNPEKPEFLMFYPSSNGLVLAGAMFLTDNFYDIGEQPGGASTLWHFHTSYQTYCFRNNIMVEFEPNGQCKGNASRRSPEMLHVWFVEHPQGDYATDMCLPAGAIEGWQGRASWEIEREQRSKKHYTLLKNRNFTKNQPNDSS